MRPVLVLLSVFSLLAASGFAHSENIKLAVTTSFHNSGLSDHLLPHIKADLGLEVRLLVVGTGQALRLGENGDVDAVLVHSRAAEEAFLKAGFGTHRREIMFNDFVILGPEADPALIRQNSTIQEALKRLRKFSDYINHVQHQQRQQHEQ